MTAAEAAEAAAAIPHNVPVVTRSKLIRSGSWSSSSLLSNRRVVCVVTIAILTVLQVYVNSSRLVEDFNHSSALVTPSKKHVREKATSNTTRSVKSKQKSSSSVVTVSNGDDEDSSSSSSSSLSLDSPYWPPLHTLINEANNTIIGNVSFLLDVAILGHAKTATTFLMKWIAGHEHVHMWDDEMCLLQHARPAELVKKLYTDFPPPPPHHHPVNLHTTKQQYFRGFKCPSRLQSAYMKYFPQYFPHTRIVIGVRHPVRWFESYYNFLVRRNVALAPLHELMLNHSTSRSSNRSHSRSNNGGGYSCDHHQRRVCTAGAAFHQNLVQLGKTPGLNDPAEQALLQWESSASNNRTASTSRHKTSRHYNRLVVANPVFLYDMNQLYDTNMTRVHQFQQTLQHFLGLDSPLPDPQSAASQILASRATKRKVLNICDAEHDALRHELLHMVGVRASAWIRQYFLSEPLVSQQQVVVANLPHLISLLEEWSVDPCFQKK